ncbi:MAG: cation:proton antiporter [Beijerinckiaceae bacterium]|nr:cation:proton antiporter [Beijerinckiaceae bacterium]
MDESTVSNLIVLGVAMALTAAIPALLPRLPLPGAVLEILLGAIAGPQILGLAHPDAILGFLADFGVGVLFLMVGFEVDPSALRGRPLRNAAAGWAISAAVALYAGFVLYATGRAQSPVFTALALSTTSLGLLLPVLRDSKLMDPPYGPMVLAAGAIGEGAPLFILPVAVAHQGEVGLHALIMVIFGVCGAFAILLASHASHGYFASMVDRTMGTSGQLPMRLALCLLILLIVVAKRFEIDFILGAFVAGAVVRAAMPKHDLKDMAARLDGIGSAFFVPVFFLTSGMLLDVTALLNSPAAWVMAAVYALLMLAARGGPALILYGRDLTMRQSMALALHSGTQLSLVIAIAGVAMRRGQMPSDQAATLVAGAVLTVLLFPALAARVLRGPAQ